MYDASAKDHLIYLKNKEIKQSPLCLFFESYYTILLFYFLIDFPHFKQAVEGFNCYHHLCALDQRRINARSRADRLLAGYSLLEGLGADVEPLKASLGRILSLHAELHQLVQDVREAYRHQFTGIFLLF